MRKIKVLVQRTAMIGGGLRYELTVPLTECTPTFQKHCTYTISHCEYPITMAFVPFNQAILPDSHALREPGIVRYDLWKSQERAAKAIEFDLAATVFPELKKLDGMPSLWAFGLMDKETSAEGWIDYTYDETKYCFNA